MIAAITAGGTALRTAGYRRPFSRLGNIQHAAIGASARRDIHPSAAEMAADSSSLHNCIYDAVIFPAAVAGGAPAGKAVHGNQAFIESTFSQ